MLNLIVVDLLGISVGTLLMLVICFISVVLVGR